MDKIAFEQQLLFPWVRRLKNEENTSLQEANRNDDFSRFLYNRRIQRIQLYQYRHCMQRAVIN